MKKIKIKLQQCGDGNLGFSYRIEQVVNSLTVSIGRQFFKVGDYVEPTQAEDLCHNRKYEVTINAIKE